MSQVITHQVAEKLKSAKIAEAKSRLTVDDYNRVLEDYLLGKRSERGYTDRDPSEYYNSSVARWAQDARDWIEFRDRVMVYGLEVLNDYMDTGIAPLTIEEFSERLAEMEVKWTYEPTSVFMSNLQN